MEYSLRQCQGIQPVDMAVEVMLACWQLEKHITAFHEWLDSFDKESFVMGNVPEIFVCLFGLQGLGHYGRQQNEAWWHISCAWVEDWTMTTM